MIHQIQGEDDDDDDDDIIDSENVDETGSDVNAGASDTENPTSINQPRAAVGSALEWRVVSIKPGGVKAANHNQYVD